VTVLRQRVAVLDAEGQRVRAERDQLAGQVERLGVGNQQLRARIGELAWQVEELRRAGTRQAAPFSNDRPNPSPRRPGRKAGDANGRRARRPVPDRVDRVVSVPLPAACPSCGGPIAFERVADQHQEDFPPPKATQITRFEVAIGRCGACRRRIQPRHPEQTSDALGAAGVQVGSRAVALAAWCNKGLGLPAGKVARLLGQLGLEISPGGMIQAVAQAARRCEPTYTALAEGVQASPVVAPDETG
jgi:transposase